jgi:hypothetical protein
VSSTLTYNVKTEGASVRVDWDLRITNNDPDTQENGDGTVLFYEDLTLPVLKGATNAAAADSGGTGLDVIVEDAGPGVAQRASVEFATRLFYGDTYDFRLSYDIPEARFPGVLVTQNYAFLPVIAAGDEATVIVNTPSGDPWQVSVEEQQCPRNGNQFACSGGSGAYLAALVEVSQPAAVATSSFQVQMERATVDVTLTYFQGEDVAAAHQRDLIAAGLPIIEQTYGFSYDSPPLVNITHGGRQQILGYEGLARCEPASCDIVISPIADDYTVLHELSHLWSGIYTKRWLSEGFAQLIAEETAPQLPEGLVTGAPPARVQSNAPFQLDDWGDVTSVIGASDADVAAIEAGYDYSLRFLQELRQRYGMNVLRAVNRNIAGSGQPADSRRFMDAFEAATGENLDDLFRLWVFPPSYDAILVERREAVGRLGVLRARLADEELPEDALIPIQERISAWEFGEALSGLDAAEANLETYGQLSAQLSTLERDASASGLTLPAAIAEALQQFNFNLARGLLRSADEALDSYDLATVKVDQPRSLWERFGLLGNDPDGELEAAARSFAEGEFGASAQHSEAASELVDDAASVAFRRLLVVAALLALVVVAIGVAVAVGQLRQRELTRPPR